MRGKTSEEKNVEEEKEEDEINIALQSIVRIMIHIISVSFLSDPLL